MKPQKILVVGSNGLLGQKLTEILLRGSAYRILLASQEPASLQGTVTADYATLDITVRKDVRRTVWDFEPDVIINAAAMTNVDACEQERELAWKVNVAGVEHLIEAARKIRARLVHISTDYVFDGKAGPYTEEDRPEPLNYYGKTKLASENALRSSDMDYVLFRTMVLYGYAPGARSNFALWLIENLDKKRPVRVVDDQMGNPTLADDLAYAVVAAMELGRTGLYNVAGREIVSRHAFALTLAEVFGFDPGLVTPTKTAELNQPALRPLLSGLVTLKAETELGLKPSTVEEGLRVLKNQLHRTMPRAADRPPAPSFTPRRNH
ncbi:MAG: dTDP-4-dehydrorhamnose reductase [Bacteroidota bacterium]